MLLYLLITSFSVLLFLKSLLSLKPLPPWANYVTLLSHLFWKELVNLSLLQKTLLKSLCITKFYSIVSLKKMALTSNTNVQKNEDGTGLTLILDLPELALERILERLSPADLLSMAGVCTSMRERCMSDHLWEKHMKPRWGRVIAPAAYRELQWQLATRKDFWSCKHNNQKGFMKLLSMFSPISWIRSKINADSKQNSPLPVDSIRFWYVTLENGGFWFPAQVYNRENGYAGFMLSCYDADLCYDPGTDTFLARYASHGRRAIATETNVPWERLRAPPVDTSPYALHVSDCLNDLRPGDHIEIQWRRNKEFPYGWWYGIVGHLESCDGNENRCRCHNSDTVVLEFHQYSPGSRWRKTTIDRKDHREEGNEADGFYGGIRKLYNNEEISKWKQLLAK
ncbi:hypothetical protein K2173_008342 [Erythroxylum novogranatense]|uniref:F-box domain-containing protein n=1 Tax=Erythroxylum novogranatense TaxID=1862640 RepID=A0AAV8TLH2_9ROSI|nr:hypothetical protein K2173_008342 [Erythroxylum novogranatense]